MARRNLLGLCSGLGRDRSRPALTEWLHTCLQQLSGKALDAPLTFADLHDAPRYAGEPDSPHAISLQMITTCVSHNEPRTLPLGGAQFWFLREEFAQLFPASVVQWLVDHAGPPLEVDGRHYHRLPQGPQLPVLVATRMSLSFPLLISAVPLHEPSRRERRCEPTAAAADPEHNVADSMEGLTSAGQACGPVITAFRICWFSDGGISSNFPIHLFDAAELLDSVSGIVALSATSENNSHTDDSKNRDDSNRCEHDHLRVTAVLLTTVCTRIQCAWIARTW